MNRRRVVITGLGCVTSLGAQVDEVWSALLAGTSGIHPIDRFNVDDYTVKIGGQIQNWDPTPHLDPRAAKRLDPFCQYACYAASEAVNDSGLDFDQEDRERCGVIIGSGIGGMAELELAETTLLQKGPRRVSPMFIPKLMVNAASGVVSIRHGLQGPNSAAVTACASAGHAIIDATKTIILDEADIMVTGASEAALTPLGLASFMTMRALSKNNDTPTTASRPFDRDRNGFVLSEGAGIIVLEEYEHAKKRGARIYAELVGYGMTADASHITQPSPEGAGAARAMKQALKSANLSTSDIDYINAHGTSTPLGDKAEHNAVKGLFGQDAYDLAMSSTKSMTGHLLGGSGGIEAIFSAKTITTGHLPPTMNLDNPDEGFDLNYVANEAQDRKVRYAMSNSFGFGGHNSTLILGSV